MEYSEAELKEAKRQILSVIRKLRETVRTLEQKKNPERLKSQITLAKRRITAFEIANQLIEEKLQGRDPAEKRFDATQAEKGL